MDSRGTLTRAELAVLDVAAVAEPIGARLAAVTRPDLGQVDSIIARRLARLDMLYIDAGACAHLTDRARRLRQEAP